MREFGILLSWHIYEIMYASVYVYIRKESTKEAERLNDVTTRQSHRLGIVWTKPSKSTANRPRFASLCVSITISLLFLSTRTRGPSFFRYLSRDSLPSSSHSIPFLERTIGRNTMEIMTEGKTVNWKECGNVCADFVFFKSMFRMVTPIDSIYKGRIRNRKVFEMQFIAKKVL